MAITFVGTNSARGTGSISVPAVAGATAGDLVLLSVMSANENVATPTNYTPIGTPQGTGTAAAIGAVRITSFYRVLSGADAATTVADSGNVTLGAKVVYRGVDVDAPFDVTAGSVQGTASTAMTWPAVTTTVDDCLIVLCCAVDTDAASTATSGALANANLTGVTERFDTATSSGVGGGVVINDGFKATAGDTGTSTSTGSTSVTRAYQTFALRTSNEVIASLGVTLGATAITATGDIFVTSVLKSWNGSAWVAKRITLRDPFNWNPKVLKAWTGTYWKE